MNPFFYNNFMNTGYRICLFPYAAKLLTKRKTAPKRGGNIKFAYYLKRAITIRPGDGRQ